MKTLLIFNNSAAGKERPLLRFSCLVWGKRTKRTLFVEANYTSVLPQIDDVIDFCYKARREWERLEQ